MRILCRIFYFKPLQYRLFRFRAPVDLQLVLSTRDSCIEDVVRDSFLSFICNYDFYRVVFQTLRLVDRDCICDLKWNNDRIVIFIILIGAPIFVYTE